MTTRDTPMRHVPLFDAVPDAELWQMAATLNEIACPEGTVLFREGEHGERFYVVLEGEFEIIKSLDTDDERHIAVRGPGEFVGEMSLLSRDGLRTASVRARTAARALELTRQDFDALLHRYPRTAYEMLQVLTNRLRDSNDATIHDLRDKNQRLAQAYADLQHAQAQLIEQKTLLRELQLAREIQESMLPARLPQLEGLDIGAHIAPAQMVGGDFFDLIRLDDNSLGIAVGDVSGKGMPAALFTALVSSLLRAEVTRGVSPSQALATLNQHLVTRNPKGMFVTLLYGVLRRDTDEFLYVRAGHECPLIWDAGGARAEVRLGRGLPLGLFPKPIFDVQSIAVPPGSTLLIYSDGVVEAMDAQQNQFGLERLYELAKADASSSAQELCDNLAHEIATYRGDAPQSDDITLVAVRVGPAQRAPF